MKEREKNNKFCDVAMHYWFIEKPSSDKTLDYYRIFYTAI
jgi:hypothetical protein